MAVKVFEYHDFNIDDEHQAVYYQIFLRCNDGIFNQFEDADSKKGSELC